MSDISLSLQPVVQRLTIEVQPPPTLHGRFTQSPPETITLHAIQPCPRIVLTIGPQIGIPGVACLPDSRSNPVFSYDNGRLTGITYADGSHKTLTYDASNRLTTLSDTAAGITRKKTFHYDSLNNLTSISAS
jgi:YD repeat-containing protein